MEFVAVVVGVFLVLSVLADLLNTLVTTARSSGRWWLTRIFYTQLRAARAASAVVGSRDG